jgi:signal transduction histidine kinase
MVVEAHQGYVEVESELHKGSTFKIYLPLKDTQSHAKN